MRLQNASILILVFSTSFLLAFPVNADLSWTIQTVDTNAPQYGSPFCPIVLDSGNNPHIFYTNFEIAFDNEAIRHSMSYAAYASWNGSGWSTQKIAGAEHIGNSAAALSLVMGKNAFPQLIYVEYYSEDGAGYLMYANWTGRAWSIQTVDTIGVSAGSIAIDSEGNPHIAYTDGTTVKFASFEPNVIGGSWNIQTVETYTSLGIPSQLSLALDKNDTPYILYDAQTLRLATLRSSSWQIQTVTSSASLFGNMVLDSKGYPHLIYVKSQTNTGPSFDHSTRIYDSWNGKTWITQNVMSNVRFSTAYAPTDLGNLALDSHDIPHIVVDILVKNVFHTDDLALQYISWTGAGWLIQTVNGSGVVGPCFLALDSNGNPQISYRGQEGSSDQSLSIMYATAVETTQTPSPVSSPLNALTFPLAITVIIVAVTVAGIVYLWKKRT